jgi:alcohol dehydrogenase (NADP+)
MRPAVTKFKPGDLAAVGCLVDSDGNCPECQDGLEQYCPHMILTYNSPDVHLEDVTYGGYSDSIVVKEHFVMRVPSNLNLAGTAPLLCAGITTYSPMRHWGVTKGKKVGVVGLGGLGHMAVKFAHALEAHVVVFTSSPNRKEDALHLGADEVISRDTGQMKKHRGSFDFILDAVSVEHDINAYIQLPAATATSPSSAHRTSLMPSLPLIFCSSVAAYPAYLSGVSPKRRRCLTFAANIISQQ